MVSFFSFDSIRSVMIESESLLTAVPFLGLFFYFSAGQWFQKKIFFLKIVIDSLNCFEYVVCLVAAPRVIRLRLWSLKTE